MKVVAYCRVSTNKEEQLDSLDSQQRFFSEYAIRHGFELVHIYADEGKSGTKMKNRPQLLKMLSDAKQGSFELVLIKDVSRLARNTLDFLTSIRKLKALGIKVNFVNYDQTSSDSSEFMLTMLSAIAQEESSNTSKRVKFGKRQNAERGKVPNLIFGYDKIQGDYYNLHINEQEAAVVRRIFIMYTMKNWGTNRIARVLNSEGIKTKRGCNWTQNGIARILSNEIYRGRIINAKQEVEDFLTGKRRNNSKEQWLVVERPDLSLIEEETFDKAQSMLTHRKDDFHKARIHNSDKHVFSQLLECKHCGASFRRLTRTYKNTYINWVCNGHNSNGSEYCENTISLDEKEILLYLENYFETVLSRKPGIVQTVIKDFNRKYILSDETKIFEKDLTSKLNKIKKDKIKFMEMYTNDIISMEELKEMTEKLNYDIQRCNQELELLKKNKEENTKLAEVLNGGYENVERLLNSGMITNSMLKNLIQTISVDKDGNVEVYFISLTENND